MMNHFLVVALFLLVPSVQPSQGNDPESDFDNFDNTFDKLDKEDKLHSTIDEGHKRWENGCSQIGGKQVLDDWLKAQENLIFAVMQNFDLVEIQGEINAKKKSGDLDLVFKKYCGKPMSDTRPYIEAFLEASSHCVKAQDRSGINVTMNMIDSAIDFMCHNSGDRMALFMAEEGIACVEEHEAGIISCLNSSVPELFLGNFQRTNWILFEQGHCRTGDVIRKCIESELLKCKDPTPSNIVNSMLLAMRNATPCRSMTARASFTAAAASSRAAATTVGHCSCFVTLLLTFLLVVGSHSLSTSSNFANAKLQL